MDRTAPDQEAAHLEYSQLLEENARLRAANTAAHDAGIAVELERLRLRDALTELYEATHGYLTVVNSRGRMRAGTPRLHAALGEARNALS